MKKIPELIFHEKSCHTCRYYRAQMRGGFTDCLLLGRTLSCDQSSYRDRARYCSAWKKRPKSWDVFTDENPFWRDKYISREKQHKLRKRAGIRRGYETNK